MLKKLIAVILLVGLSSQASAGPLRDAVEHAKMPAQAPKSGGNRMLLPGLCLVGGGVALSMFGFLHTTGAEFSSNDTGTNVAVAEKHATGVGFAGLAIAGVGGFLIYKGAQDAKRPAINLRSDRVTVSVRF